MKPITGIPTTRSAICHLQAEVRGRFGKVAPFIEGSGECTLYIGTKSVLLTNETGNVIASGPAKCASALCRATAPVARTRTKKKK